MDTHERDACLWSIPYYIPTLITSLNSRRMSIRTEVDHNQPFSGVGIPKIFGSRIFSLVSVFERLVIIF